MWPYTWRSNCTETLAEYKGAAFVGFSVFHAVVSLAFIAYFARDFMTEMSKRRLRRG